MTFPIIHTSEFDDKPRVIAIKVDEWIRGEWIDLLDTGLPAPSKDFKPKCYYDMINHGHRDDEGHIIYDGRVFKCVSCDIREQCIYKRE